MRKVMVLLTLVSPLAMAESLSVGAHSVLRLPNKSSVVQLERLDVADYGTLLLPASLTELNVGSLRLGREARIAVVPAAQALRIEAGAAELADGSQILAHGAPGTFEKAAMPGRDLELRLHRLQAAQLSIDARGGAGAPGYVGLDGANGKAGGCTWGQAEPGANGQNGGDGHDGAAGGRVLLALPASYPEAQIKVRVDGGAPGLAGVAGKPGKGGASKGCFVYRTQGGASGKPGAPGQPGLAGAAGAFTLKRL